MATLSASNNRPREQPANSPSGSTICGPTVEHGVQLLARIETDPQSNRAMIFIGAVANKSYPHPCCNAVSSMESWKGKLQALYPSSTVELRGVSDCRQTVRVLEGNILGEFRPLK